MSYLYLNLKGEYFDEIKSGVKKLEYRFYNNYWKKRLMPNGYVSKEWEGIIIRRGYPKKHDYEKQMHRPWAGLSVETITHPHFGGEPVKVFAIRVN